jgi:hypothetical protein
MASSQPLKQVSNPLPQNGSVRRDIQKADTPKLEKNNLMEWHVNCSDGQKAIREEFSLRSFFVKLPLSMRVTLGQLKKRKPLKGCTAPNDRKLKEPLL